MELQKWEWMVKPTPQRDWIVGKGMLSWLSFYSVAIGAGIYFVSIFLNYNWAMLTGWLVCLVIGGGTKFLDLGKPSRFWRMLITYKGEDGLKGCMLMAFKNPVGFIKMLWTSGWRQSWISRGMFFIGLFAILGAVHLGLAFTNTAGATAMGYVLAVVSFLVIIYAGLLIGYVKAIPLWGTALMPLYFVISAFAGGAVLALAGRINNATIMQWVQILVLSYAGIVIIMLWNAWNHSEASKYSVQKMISSSPYSIIFYLGVVILGIIIPVTASIMSMVVGIGSVPLILLALSIAGILIGDLSMRYLIMRCGTYVPLIPRSIY